MGSITTAGDVLTVLVVTPEGAAPAFVPELAHNSRYQPAGRVVPFAEAAEAVRERTPDVAIVVPASLNQLERIARVVFQAVPTVVVCGMPDEAALLSAMAQGARAFVRTPLERGMLAHAVSAAAQGRTYIDPRSAAWLVDLALRGNKARDALGLSPRQAQVIELASGGLTNAEIAAVLGVSVETVKSHVQQAMRRLDVHDRREAARRTRVPERRR